MVTKRQAYERLKARLDGGELLARRGSSCWYSKAFNGGCAIGEFIPDELYDESMENVAASTLFYEHKALRSHFEDWESYFWTKLQHAHDRAGDFDRSTRALRHAEGLI